MNKMHVDGFTLIELLTVIAIIGILAAISAVALPRALEAAKVTKTKTTMTDLRTAMATYYTAHTPNTYPPIYGYRDRTPNGRFMVPYLTFIGRYGVPAAYDDWAETYDTDGDGFLSKLEYSPIAVETTPGTYVFELDPAKVYDKGDPDIEEQRPLFYIPVNKRQFDKVQKYYWANGTSDLDRMYARVWDKSDPLLAQLRFPPPFYDAFVLISVGPRRLTFGVLPSDLPAGLNSKDPDLYHIQALRAYFLATRDANKDGFFDFDFQSRTKQNDADPDAYVINGVKILDLNLLPDGSNLHGPMIYAYGN